MLAGHRPKLEADFAPLADFLDDGPDPVADLGKGRFVLAADVEAQICLARDFREGMLRGIRAEHPEGDGKVVARRFHAFPQRLHRHDEFRRRDDGVLPQRPRRCTGMRISTMADRLAIAEAASYPGDEADRDVFGQKNRRLLDMGFEICNRAPRVDDRAPLSHRLGIKTLVPHVLCEGQARIAAPDRVEDGRIEPAERGLAADIAMRKPAALFRPKAEDAEVERRFFSHLRERRKRRHADEDAGRSIEIPAMRNGIEMRADIDGPAGIPSGERDELVAGGIERGRRTEAPAGRGDHREGLPFALAIGDPRHARRVGGALTHGVEQFPSEGRTGLERSEQSRVLVHVGHRIPQAGFRCAPQPS